MEEFEIKGSKLVKYHEQNNMASRVVIPDGITEIGERCFECSKISNIIIPDSVIEIRNGAFANCSNLTDIIIPDNVEEIGMRCFYNCPNLRNIKLSNKLTYIWNGAFQACINLTSITLPEGIMYIGDQAFDNCESLTSLIIPDKVTDIRDFAFWDCIKLEEITIPNSVTYIGNLVFDECENLKRINISSYKTFSLLNYDLRALNTIIKNMQQFSEEDVNKFKKYIIENKMNIINYILENSNLLDLLNYMLIDMKQIYTEEEINLILNKVINLKKINNRAEITGILLEYKNKNFGFDNLFNKYDLGEFNNDEVNSDNDKGKNEKGRLK